MSIRLETGEVVTWAEYQKHEAKPEKTPDPPPDPEELISPEAIQELVTELESNAARLELLRMQDAAAAEKRKTQGDNMADVKPVGISDEGWAFELELRRQKAQLEAAKVLADEEANKPFDMDELRAKTFADLSPDRQNAYRRDVAKAVADFQNGR